MLQSRSIRLSAEPLQDLLRRQHHGRRPAVLRLVEPAAGSLLRPHGKKDLRGAYGLHAREMLAWLMHLQQARAINVVFVGILETVTDDFNRTEHRLQLEGARTGRELPAHRRSGDHLSTGSTSATACLTRSLRLHGAEPLALSRRRIAAAASISSRSRISANYINKLTKPRTAASL